VSPEQIIAEIRRYETDLSDILERFVVTDRSIYIRGEDDPRLRQIVHELYDLFNDSLGKNSYSQHIAIEFASGTSNSVGSPSYKSVENIISLVRAAITRLDRNPTLLERRKAEETLRHRENVFIIHGRDEAKWRELKDIVRSEFRLNPIVLSEQPDIGVKTIIEKFEHYASTCSYAIAVFTPDDEVTSGGDTYL
jgi:hypothetical protein